MILRKKGNEKYISVLFGLLLSFKTSPSHLHLGRIVKSTQCFNKEIWWLEVIGLLLLRNLEKWNACPLQIQFLLLLPKLNLRRQLSHKLWFDFRFIKKGKHSLQENSIPKFNLWMSKTPRSSSYRFGYNGIERGYEVKE